MASNIGAWRVVFAETATDKTVATFDCEISQLSRYVSPKVGELDLVIPIPNREVGAAASLVIGGEGRLSMYAYRGAELWWGGFVDRTEINSGGTSNVPVLAVSGATFEAYPDRREVRYDDSQTMEQTHWAKFLWDYMQAEYGGNILVTTPAPTPSGRSRAMSWERGDTKTVGSVLKEISNRVDGFEWIIDTYADESGRRQRTLLTGYPHIGRPNAGYMMTFPGNVLDYRIAGDALEGATSFQARGKTPDPVGAAGTPGNKDGTGGGGTPSEKQPPLMSAIFTADDWLRRGYTRTDTTLDRDTVSEKSTLDSWAKLARDMRTGPLVLPEITCRMEGFGQAILGSNVTIRISDWPFKAGPNGAPGWDSLARCIGYEINPGELGAEDVVKLIFENPYDKDNLKRSPD